MAAGVAVVFAEVVVAVAAELAVVGAGVAGPDVVALSVVLVVGVNHPPQDWTHRDVAVSTGLTSAATAIQCPVGTAAFLQRIEIHQSFGQ